MEAVSKTTLEGLRLLNRGKVRDVYELDEESLLFIATDRISAFDCVMPNAVPNKGAILTQISKFWFDLLKDVVRNHRIASDFEEFPSKLRADETLKYRSLIVKKLEIFPVECVVRGYLEGSGWKDYQETGRVCGHELPEGLQQCDKLPEPLFTPATKAPSGHDININFETFSETIGTENANELRRLTLEIYEKASVYALEKGIIIADTKFEFGLDSDGNIVLADEVLTPDSSRFWEASKYEPGRAQASFDKQFVREYLETLDWDKTPPAPELPEEIVNATINRYEEAFERLTGQSVPWGGTSE